ncbi:methyltransferase domain-containing protein [Paeniglutamicibacter kerguelensis]|uniref:2-polyprenyl-3-methyl-5-hydroxy-6-metoxy-1, 4-benzoquinol methylase n=1 Tax=Paeniglutamicibacter kerguelensis TaxID=254788 RepID=A0ABS4X8T9_9MICC|nr:methyltransferase domain-containing protein [Paeniglutamicibacter kerguelensis]MBP2384766.1 2-polyprenyl-3-methyl-5-hydroxy-6-metoxy-1,4-benzoquinol methylase [Paeniglutamicibacter kerguelensis]
MDRPDCDPLLLERTYAQFPLVNRFVSGWRQVYVALIRPALPRNRTGTILDIGCGGGDITRNLFRWATADGFDVRVVGIDPDARAHDYAVRSAAKAGIDPTLLEFRRAASSELVSRGERFDVVVSNHVLHHLGPVELAGVFADTERLARTLAIHSDIRRRRSALVFFGLATLPLDRSSYIRRDGLTSIRRSFTADELSRVVRPEWHVYSPGLYRNLAVWHAPAALP